MSQNDSCNFTISGTLLDRDTKAPIPFASVSVQNTSKYTMTNENGEFSFKGLCSKENTLIILCSGYCDSICESHHQHGKIPHIYLKQKVYDLDAVTIETEKPKEEGTESLSQISVSKAQIAENPNQSLAATIAKEQGLSFTSLGTNVEIPIIHGLYGNRILILNNGLKHGFQNWGTDHAPEIDINSAHNITILKGASSVQFGPEAMGGAIIVESNPMYLNEPLYTNFTSGYQTNGRGISNNFEIGKGGKKWSYFANGMHNKIGDRNAPEYILSNTGKEELSIGFGGRYHNEHIDIKSQFSFLNQVLGIPRASLAESGNALVQGLNSSEPTFIRPFTYDIGAPKQMTQHYFAKTEVNWWYSDEGKIKFIIGQQRNIRKEYDVRRSSDKPIIDLDLITSDYQLEWKHPDWYHLDGIIGLQYFNQNSDNNPGTGITPLIPNYNINRISAFAIESKKLKKNTFEAGIRFDYENNNIRGRQTNQNVFRDEYNFSNFNTSLGYIRNVNNKITFRSNVGVAWRTPNMAELYSFGQHGFKSSFGLLRYQFNNEGDIMTNQVLLMEESDIKPEKGYKWIHEFQFKNDHQTHSITAYTNLVLNYVQERPLSLISTLRGPNPLFIYEQTDVFMAGVDYSWAHQWIKNIEGTFGASYLWSRNIENGSVLIAQPPINLNYAVEWNFPEYKNLKTKILLEPSYTFEQFQAPQAIDPEDILNLNVTISEETEIFDFQEAPEGFFLLNASVRFEWKHLSGQVRVNNLLDTKYRNYLNTFRYFADELGRNIVFNLSYKFQAKQKNVNK